MKDIKSGVPFQLSADEFLSLVGIEEDGNTHETEIVRRVFHEDVLIGTLTVRAMRESMIEALHHGYVQLDGGQFNMTVTFQHGSIPVALGPITLDWELQLDEGVTLTDVHAVSVDVRCDGKNECMVVYGVEDLRIDFNIMDGDEIQTIAILPTAYGLTILDITQFTLNIPS